MKTDTPEAAPAKNTVAIKLEYTELEFRSLSALAAFNGESVEDYAKRAVGEIASIHTDTIKEEIRGGLAR